MTNSEYLTLSKELQYLVKNTSLTWGRIQNNKTDNKIDMFNCANYQDLLIKSKNLDDDEIEYFKRRWFLWQCSRIDEYLFYKEKNVKKNPLAKDKTWDVIFNNFLKFDIKGTVVPKILRKGFSLNSLFEKKCIDYYYRNQSKGVRYYNQNRLFIVHHSFKNEKRNIFLRCHWDLKVNAFNEFNKLITGSKVKLIHNKKENTFSKCIFIIESQKDGFYFKII